MDTPIIRRIAWCRWAWAMPSHEQTMTGHARTRRGAWRAATRAAKGH